MSVGGVLTGAQHSVRSNQWYVKTYALFLLPTLLVIPIVFVFVSIQDTNTISAKAYYQSQVDLFLLINGKLSESPWFWENITELGDALIFFPLVAPLIWRSPQTWAALFGAVPLSAILSGVGKNITAVPRPAAVIPQDAMNIVGRLLTGHNSLPSGHTITAVAIFTVLVGSFIMINQNKRAKILVTTCGIGIASLIALSRVAIGAHWPIDVVVGACLGITGGASGLLLAQRYKKWWSWIDTNKGCDVFGVIMLLWGISIVNDNIYANSAGLFVPWIAGICAIASGIFLMYRAIKSLQTA